MKEANICEDNGFGHQYQSVVVKETAQQLEEAKVTVTEFEIAFFCVKCANTKRLASVEATA